MPRLEFAGASRLLRNASASGRICSCCGQYQRRACYGQVTENAPKRPAFVSSKPAEAQTTRIPLRATLVASKHGGKMLCGSAIRVILQMQVRVR
jgi:hypothetical protein